MYFLNQNVRAFNPSKWPVARYLSLPTSKGNWYWVLFTVELVDHVIYYKDDLHGSCQTKYRTLLSWLGPHYGTLPWTNREARPPHHCGIFTSLV